MCCVVIMYRASYRATIKRTRDVNRWTPPDMHVRRHVKGTASIKMREIYPSHVKETSFTCSLMLGDKLNTKMLIVVLECLKDRSSLYLWRGQLRNVDKGL